MTQKQEDEKDECYFHNKIQPQHENQASFNNAMMETFSVFFGR